MVTAGIDVDSATNVVITNCNLSGAEFGVYLITVTNFILENNILSGTTLNASISGNSGVQKISGNIGVADNGFAYAAGDATAVTTASTTYVATGFGIVYTPVKTGNVLIKTLQTVSNNTAADITFVEVTYIAGTALAAAGTAVAGTVVPYMHNSITQGANINEGYFLVQEQVLTGLTIGTSYVFEPYISVSAGTGNYLFTYMSVEELG